jgi:hypothetical protein
LHATTDLPIKICHSLRLSPRIRLFQVPERMLRINYCLIRLTGMIIATSFRKVRQLVLGTNVTVD